MNIKDIPSPNYTKGRKSYRPEAIVIHIMEGSLSGTDDWFTNIKSNVSAHYGIGKEGSVHRYVQEEDTAWHAGRIHAPTCTLLKPKGNQYVNPNYYTIGIEHEGFGNSEWTDAMYLSSSSLIRDICKRWNIPIDRQHIIGHHEIYSLKTCPGSKVSLAKLIAMAANTTDMAILSFTPSAIVKIPLAGKAVTTAQLNIRTTPCTNLPPRVSVPAGVPLSFAGFTNDGETVKGINKWYYNEEGNWFWSGAVKINGIMASTNHAINMTPDKACIDFIKSKEVLELNAYEDIAGVWKIGYGTIRYEDGSTVIEGQTITKERAEQLLAGEIMLKSTKVNAAIQGVQLHQHQYNALVSFAYNVGVGALLHSTLLKRVKANPADPGIRDAFLMWDKVQVDGTLVAIDGLRKRREEEADMYFT